MLELIGLYKTFNPGTVNEKRAINGLNLTLEDGDFVTIIGGNGAGKSTTLNLIAGAIPADQGNHPAGRGGSHPPAGAQAGQVPGAGVPGPHDGHRRHHGHRGEPGSGQPPR